MSSSIINVFDVLISEKTLQEVHSVCKHLVYFSSFHCCLAPRFIASESLRYPTIYKGKLAPSFYELRNYCIRVFKKKKNLPILQIIQNTVLQNNPFTSISATGSASFELWMFYAYSVGTYKFTGRAKYQRQFSTTK